MSEHALGETPAVTQRLVFDAPSDADVPAFLRKGAITNGTDGDADRDVREPFVPAAVSEPDVFDADDTSDDEEEEVAVLSTASKAPDLDHMSVEELKRQQEEIDRKIREKQEAEKRAVIEQIVNVVNTYHIPVDELFDALGGVKPKRKGVKAQPKYQDPVTGALWSGRGKEPVWIRGKDRAAFLIEQNDDDNGDEETD